VAHNLSRVTRNVGDQADLFKRAGGARRRVRLGPGTDRRLLTRV